MSKLLLKVLGNYNQQLAATLARAEQHWPALCADEVLTEAEIENRRRTLLLAITYLDQLQRLLCRHADQHEAAAFWESSRLLPDIRPAH